MIYPWKLYDVNMDCDEDSIVRPGLISDRFAHPTEPTSSPPCCPALETFGSLAQHDVRTGMEGKTKIGNNKQSTQKKKQFNFFHCSMDLHVSKLKVESGEPACQTMPNQRL